MRTKVVGSLIFLALLAGGHSALAIECAEFTKNSAGTQCGSLYFFPRVSLGGGWSTTLRGSNYGGGMVQFTLYLYDSDKGNFEPLVAFLQDAQSGFSGKNFAMGVWLYSGNSDQVSFFPVPGEEGVVKNGTLWAGYQADNPSDLRGLAPPWVQVCNTSGMCASETGVSPASRWRGTFSATADGKQGYSMAIGNPTDSDVSVEGTLYDRRGLKLQTQIWNVPKKGGAVAMVLTVPEMFSGGQQFTGWIELKALSGGQIVPVAFLFQKNGGMSSAPMDPIR